MPFARSLPFLAAVVVSAGLWALGLSLAPPGSGYAALICSNAVPDREIVRRLEGQGFTGIVSESGQWVFVDSFEALEKVPLDQYNERLLPFDPRKDPYAEKLRSLFIQDEKRIVYLPVHSAVPVKKLNAALADIPYTCEYSSGGGAWLFFLILFVLAGVAFFVVRPLRLALRPDAASLLPCLPALAPLALGGAVGFAQISLLAGCAVLLAGPCLQRFDLRQRNRQNAPRPLSLQLQRLRRLPLFLPVVFVGCYGAAAWFWGLPFLFALLVLVLFGGLFTFSLWIAAGGALNRGLGGDYPGGNGAGWLQGLFMQAMRRRFAPVPILSRPAFSPAFSWAMLPFAVIALALLFVVTPASGPANFSFLPPSGALTEEDYLHHYLYQSTFSYRQLHAQDTPSAMNVYELAPDGLPRQVLGGDAGLAPEESAPGGMPPFPLVDLVRFLNHRVE